MEAILQIAQTVRCTQAEGPGKRYAIWFQGCPLRCPSCCNPEMLPFEGGNATAVSELVADIQSARESLGVQGITLIGGEPFAHAEGAAILAQEVQQTDMSVMIFSGYTLAEIQQSKNLAVAHLLAHTDLLVDGPYEKNLPDTTRRWVGSTNQQIHFLSDRYDPDDDCWSQNNTLEIRLEDNQLSVNGFPAKSAVGLWKRPSGNRQR